MADWFTDGFANEYRRQAELLGRFNLGIFGKTGVGKSTLINAVFGEEVAQTGIGEPVTMDSHLYVDKHGTLGLIDTRGLEIGHDDKAIEKDLTKSIEAMRRKPVNDQIHAAWYCVRGMDRRFEDSEAAVISTLDKLGVPVIVVFTQVPMRDGRIHPDALELAEQLRARHLPIVDGRPFFTFAMRDQFTDQPPYGLVELMQATFQAAPEAVHGALAAAQKVDLQAKAKAAQAFIGASAAGAATVAASPIPFSDAALLVPLQLGMMARIAQLYGLRFDRAALLAIASTSIATSAGRASVTSLIKLIPGAGTVAGGAVNATVASTFTFAMGQAWLTVCQRALGGTLPTLNGVLDQQAVRDLFMAEFRRRMPHVTRPGR